MKKCARRNHRGESASINLATLDVEYSFEEEE